MNWVIRLISDIRAVRAELNVPAGAQIKMLVKGASALTRTRLVTHDTLIKKLARLAEIDSTNETPKASAQIVLEETTFILPLEGVIDIAQESERLAKESDKQEAEIKKVESKLANENFVSRAPEDVIAEHRERLEAAKNMVAKLAAARKSLAG
jgi:valyl-tRNA synthetase